MTMNEIGGIQLLLSPSTFSRANELEVHVQWERLATIHWTEYINIIFFYDYYH